MPSMKGGMSSLLVLAWKTQVASSVFLTFRQIFILQRPNILKPRKSATWPQQRHLRPVPPSFYAYFLVQKAYIGILTGSKDSDILENVAAAEAVYLGLGHHRTVLCSWVKAELELYQGHFQSARSKFEECLSRSLGAYPSIAISCLAALGDPRKKLYNPWSTLRWAMTYFVLIQKNKHLVATAHAVRCLGDVFAVLGDEETALSLFHTALEGATKLDIHRLRAECMVGIGDIMSLRGDMVNAKEMWEAAHPLFIRSSQTKDAAAIETQLTELSFARENEEGRVESPEVGYNAQATANEEESKKLGQCALLSVPENSPSAVAEGSMQPTSTKVLENATGELICTIHYLSMLIKH
ncbi:hypothetical protein B0H14DRAFT_2642852 [Mycena olivaceomarginata]|nr:hypothetical protein B0H14DRAFT_2642852 [Mycena olivaceomarginata]